MFYSALSQQQKASEHINHGFIRKENEVPNTSTHIIYLNLILILLLIFRIANMYTIKHDHIQSHLSYQDDLLSVLYVFLLTSIFLFFIIQLIMSICEWVWGHFMEHGKHAKSHTLKMKDSPSSNHYQYLLY